MNTIENLALEAFEKLKAKYPNIPTKGLLAGGALANVINKLKYPDSKCVINDIDIFVLDGVNESFDCRQLESTARIYNTTRDDNVKITNFENYRRILEIKTTESYIRIKASEREDIFNYVLYDTNKYNPLFLIETFDINCCAVAIDLETKKVYYTADFKEYIETKQLKVSRPNSPSHTCIRLLKKRDELNALLDIKEEFRFLQLANDYHIIEDVRYFFADDKYLKSYIKYKNEISEYFTLQIKHNDKSKYNDEYDSYRLYPNQKYEPHLDPRNTSVDFKIFDNKILMKDFVYFYRIIIKDPKKLKIWKELNHFYKHDGYLYGYDYNTEYSEVVRYLNTYSATILSLSGMTLVEQIECVSSLNGLFLNDKKAESVLEFYPKCLKHIYNDYDELSLEMRINQIKYRGLSIHKTF